MGKKKNRKKRKTKTNKAAESAETFESIAKQQKQESESSHKASPLAQDLTAKQNEKVQKQNLQQNETKDDDIDKLEQIGAVSNSKFTGGGDAVTKEEDLPAGRSRTASEIEQIQKAGKVKKYFERHDSKRKIPTKVKQAPKPAPQKEDKELQEAKVKLDRQRSSLRKDLEEEAKKQAAAEDDGFAEFGEDFEIESEKLEEPEPPKESPEVEAPPAVVEKEDSIEDYCEFLEPDSEEEAPKEAVAETESTMEEEVEDTPEVIPVEKEEEQEEANIEETVVVEKEEPPSPVVMPVFTSETSVDAEPEIVLVEKEEPPSEPEPVKEEPPMKEAEPAPEVRDVEPEPAILVETEEVDEPPMKKAEPVPAMQEVEKEEPPSPVVMPVFTSEASVDAEPEIVLVEKEEPRSDPGPVKEEPPMKEAEPAFEVQDVEPEPAVVVEKEEVDETVKDEPPVKEAEPAPAMQKVEKEEPPSPVVMPVFTSETSVDAEPEIVLVEKEEPPSEPEPVKEEPPMKEPEPASEVREVEPEPVGVVEKEEEKKEEPVKEEPFMKEAESAPPVREVDHAFIEETQQPEEPIQKPLQQVSPVISSEQSVDDMTVDDLKVELPPTKHLAPRQRSVSFQKEEETIQSETFPESHDTQKEKEPSQRKMHRASTALLLGMFSSREFPL